MNLARKIILKIANMFGLELADTSVTTQNAYSNSEDAIPLTAIISNKVSTLALMDSEIKVVGDSAKAQFIDKLLAKYIWDRIAVASEVALGTGDCLLKPFTDGENIGIDIVKRQDFLVLESIGDTIISCAIKADEVKKGMDVYTRIEIQTLKDNLLIIKQLAFFNEQEVSLSSVDKWAGIEPELAIQNATSLLFGRIKCPTVNRDDVNSVQGVPITFGTDEIMKNVVSAYERFNQEFEDKETYIFAPKTLFEVDERGNSVLPKGKKRLFMDVNLFGDNANMIQEYSPPIRDVSLEKGLDVNLKMLEMSCALSAGILTSPHTNYATATEMKASIQNTFAYISKFRKFIETGVNGLFNAIDVLTKINLSIDGDYQLEFDWSTAFVEQLNEQFNRLMQAESIGAVDKAEVRQFVFDEDYRRAKERVAEIQSEQGLEYE